MMNNTTQELLQELSRKIEFGEIRREEVISRLHLELAVGDSNGGGAESGIEKNRGENSGAHFSSFSTTKILYILGAAVVIIGIIAFVSQIWDGIGSFGRIVITLGMGLLLTVSGSFQIKKSLGEKQRETLGLVFQTIGGALIPGGAMVTLSELGVQDISLWSFTGAFGIIFVFYLLLNSVHKNAVLSFFAIANGTAFLYALLGAILENAGLEYILDDIYAYFTMAIGAGYLLLAHSFRDGWNTKLIGILHFFGAAGFLGAAFSQVFGSGAWQIFYFFLVMGGMVLSGYMKSKSILVVSTISLIAHISYITGKYFADSIGWPISLVILGFVFIGLGFFSVNINKKYIAG